MWVVASSNIICDTVNYLPAIDDHEHRHRWVLRTQVHRWVLLVTCRLYMRFPGCASNFNSFEGETFMCIIIKWLSCDYDVSASSGICQVLFSHVTKYETESVVLPCFTKRDVKVEWKIISHLQDFILGYERRIYTNYGIQRGFHHTGRYSVSEGNGFYNLTIMNLNISETGEYICIDNRGLGPRSSIHLFVNGELWIGLLQLTAKCKSNFLI